MAVYTNDLRLKEIATGDEAGTWGNSTNTNLQLIADAFGFGTEAITTNADTHTTTIADGSADPGRSIFLKYTGTLDSACTITIGPNTVSKLWLIENATSGSQNIIIKQGSGATVTIANGQTKAIYSDGAGSGGAMVDAFQDLSIPDLFIDDDLTFTSDSAVITFGADGDTTLTHTDGSGLTLNSTNKLMFNDASQFIQGSSATVLSLGATDEIDLTATAIDVNGTMDVSGDVTTIGIKATESVNGDPVLGHFFNANSGAAAESTVYITNSSTVADGLFLQAYGASATTAGGFVQDSATLGAGTGASGGLSIMTRAAADMRFYTSGHTNERMRIDSSGNIGIGESDNSGYLAPDLVVVAKAQNGGITVKSSSTSHAGTLAFADATSGNDTYDGYVQYEHNNRALTFAAAGGEGMRLSGTTELIVNDGSGDLDFRVEGATNANLLFIDAGNERVLVGTNNGDIDGSVAGVSITETGEIRASTESTTFLFAPFIGGRRGTNNTGDILIQTMGGFAKSSIGVLGQNNSSDNGGISLSTIAGNATATERFRTGVTETVVNEPGNDHDFRIESTGFTHQLFVDAGNNTVGIGASTPSATLEIASSSSGALNALTLYNSGTAAAAAVQQNFTLERNASAVEIVGGRIKVEKEQEWTGTASTVDATMSFHTVINEGLNERLSITADGQVNILNTCAFGTTSRSGGAGVANVAIDFNGSTANGFKSRDFNGTSGGAHFIFVSSSTQVGSITTTTSATTYNTSSDYRLKENVTYDWDASARLKQLKPARFNFKSEPDTTVDGFLAHEVTDFCPQSVIGDKDATKTETKLVLSADGEVLDSDVPEEKFEGRKAAGNYPSDSTWLASREVPDYQSIDHSKIVPLLVKSLQEAIEKIETLETKVAALEGGS